ncbi:HK97 gp10 family phage protein [Clostridium perfringens]|nr:HK97 gp10 family phage protein [Clostridium perfringens]
MSVTIDDKEFKEGIDKFISQQLRKSIIAGMEKACLKIEDIAKDKAPKDLGQLAGSIGSEVEDNGSEVDGFITATAEHASYVHEGTGIYAKGGNGRKTPWFYKNRDGKVIKTNGQMPQPFMQEAIDEEWNNISKIIAGACKW